MQKALIIALVAAVLAFTSCVETNRPGASSAAATQSTEPDTGTLQKEQYIATDSVLTLSPDGKKGAYIKTLKGSTPSTEELNTDIDQIWLYDIPSNKASIIIRGTENATVPETTLESLGSLVFSPDGRYLYFTSSAWATSGAIHRFDMSTGTEKFISPGNHLEVVPSGKYKGFLITNLHKYYEGGGSYDYYYLLTIDGKEVMLAGKDEEAKDKFLAKHK